MRWSMSILVGVLTWGWGVFAYAEYSYHQAWQKLASQSTMMAAVQHQYQADVLHSQSLNGLGGPEVSLNVHALAYRQSVQVPLTGVVNHAQERIQSQLQNHMSHILQLGLNTDTTNQLTHGAQELAYRTLERLPDSLNLHSKDAMIRPAISISMPLYTGGLIRSAKTVAELQQQHSQLSVVQQRALVQLELIRQYFEVQLQKQLLDGSKHNYQAMQLHADNANKLEQQGFISKGQRMQFEVARNQALRLYQATDTQYQTALFALRTLISDATIEGLSTPLFINTTAQFEWHDVLQNLQTTPLVQKMTLDTRLAQEKITVHQAAQKPKVFAIGQYTLDGDHDWFVGVGMNAPLLSGIDHQKQIHAAKLQQQSLQMINQHTTEQMMTVLHTAMLQFDTAQKSHQLLEHNLQAAKENLRIQKLAFAEGVGVVSGVVDAQNAVSQVYSDMATNAYRYVLALATILHTTGKLDEFEWHIQHSIPVTIKWS